MTWTKKTVSSTTWDKKTASSTTWGEKGTYVNFSMDVANFSMVLIGWGGRTLWQENT